MARAPKPPLRYRQPLWGGLDRPFRNTLRISSGLGALFLLAILLTPKPAPEQKSVEEMPERLAKLILQKPQAEPAPAPKPASKTLADDPQLAQSEPKTPEPQKPKAQRRESPQQVAKKDPSTGQRGRAVAKEQVETQVASVTQSLDQTLATLNEALPESKTATTRRRPTRRGRGVGSARSSQDIASAGDMSSDSQAEVGGSLGGVSVEVGSIESSYAGGELGGSGGSGTGGNGTGGDGSGGELRSNASLLGVVRRYAAGIQYCYEDELKSSPELRGKIVLSITVAANGGVDDVHIVQDTLGNAGVGDCMLSQVRAWRFPAIDTGSVTFRTPFVFTPGG